MKKSKIETTQTRRRIVAAAAVEFRRNGIDATPLDDVMAAAGLTRGGFYRHFASKDQLVAEACAADADKPVVELTDAATSKGGGKGGLEAIVEDYFSADHANCAEGCSLVFLGSELARANDEVRAAASAVFFKLVDLVGSQYRQTKPEVAKSMAIVTVSAMIGAMTMSRIVTDPALSEEILQQTKKYLIEL